MTNPVLAHRGPSRLAPRGVSALARLRASPFLKFAALVFGLLLLSVLARRIMPSMYSVESPFSFHHASRAASNAHAQRVCHDAASTMQHADPVDVVYTWVNGSDTKFHEVLSKWKVLYKRGRGVPPKIADKEKSADQEDAPLPPPLGARARRFNDNDELRYSMRSLEKYAPWIRTIYIVTNGQVPTWLDRRNPRVKIVTHEEIFKIGHASDHLPTFNSGAIETHLHRIPGLSKKFIYFNDDVFLAAPVTIDDFIDGGTGSQKVYLAWELPDCARGCSDSFIGDKYCDAACNVSQCNFDGGDCAGVQANGKGSSLLKNLERQVAYGEESEDSESDDEGDDDHHRQSAAGAAHKANDLEPKPTDTCAKGCVVAWVADGICDASCRAPSCGFDGGDCAKDAKAPPTSMLSLNLTSSPTTVAFAAHSKQLFFSFLLKNPDNATALVSASVTETALEHARVRTTAVIKKWKSVLVMVRLDSEHGFNVNNGTAASPSLGSLVLKIGRTTKTEKDANKASQAKSSPPPPPAEEDAPPPLPGFEDEAWAAPDEQLTEEDGDQDETTARNAVQSYTILLTRLPFNESSVYGEPGGRDGFGAPNATHMSHGWELDGEEKGPPTPYPTVEPTEPDFFGLSLLHTKSHLRAIFPKRIELSNKVVAHMPHLFDVRVIDKLQSALPELYRESSAHKFRDETDVQFSYAYFTYLMADSEVLREPQVKVMWETYVDVDTDGCANENEFRTLAGMILASDADYAKEELVSPTFSPVARTGDAALSLEEEGLDDDYATFKQRNGESKLTPFVLKAIEKRIWKDAASKSTSWSRSGPSRACLSLAVLRQSERAFVAMLKAGIESRKRTAPGFVLGDTASSVAFAMLRDNETDVLRLLDGIRATRSKFICLNDDSKDGLTPEAAKALRLFYDSILPKRSAFELVPGAIPVTLAAEEDEAMVAWLLHVVLVGFVLVMCGLILVVSMNRYASAGRWKKSKRSAQQDAAQDAEHRFKV